MKKLREDFNKHQTETKAHYKKGDIWLEEDNTKHKRWGEQRYGKLEEKELNRNPANKKFL
jgi:ferritin-like metal-binding protein YciE